MPAAAVSAAIAAASAVGLPLTYVLAGWLGPPRHVAATVLVCKDATRLVTGSRRGNLWMWRVQRPESPTEPPTVRGVLPAPQVGWPPMATDDNLLFRLSFFTQISPMLVMLGHRAPVTAIVQATVEGEFSDSGAADVIISASEDGYASRSWPGGRRIVVLTGCAILP